MSLDLPTPLSHITAIGYTHAPNGLPLETFEAKIPNPAPNELLVHVVSSSLNPLDHKLAERNFLGRTPPVQLGFDFAGIVVVIGDKVTSHKVGDAVFGMVPSNQDGVWATGGVGSYALVPEFLAAHKPAGLSFVEAGTMGICYLSAFLALNDVVTHGSTLYIPGGGGGVGHLAIQKARALGAKLIVSSGGSETSRALAKASGADHVFDYRKSNVVDEIAKLTDGKGVDVVYDATYNEDCYVDSAKAVRSKGDWVVLGVGPGKTTRNVETESPVSNILASKDARLVNVNLLSLFSASDADKDAGYALLNQAVLDAAATTEAGTVKPHVPVTIPCEVPEINMALDEMRAQRNVAGKIAVIIDASRAR